MMPQIKRSPSSHRCGNTLAVPVSVPPPSSMAYYSARPVSGYYEDLNSAAAPTAPMHMSYDPYAVVPLALPTSGSPVGHASLPPQHRASSGAWTPEGDQVLLQARACGQNWNQIQANHFPGKTGNACRKRHERLMERRGADDWDSRKLERLSKEYMSMRKKIWQPLAQRCGERWNVVEQKCMSNGLKNIQSHARAYVRWERLESRQPLTGHDDNVRVSAMRPGHDLDTHRSPERSADENRSGCSKSSATSTPGYAHCGFVGHPSAHQYTSSVSSTSTAGYAPASQASSPRLDGSRLPSVGDMGIGTLIHRESAFVEAGSLNRRRAVGCPA